MTYSDKLEITHTYRNSQELIDIAGNFIQKNDEQFKKTLKSPKNIKYPVVIFSYNDDQTKNEKKGTLGILYEKESNSNINNFSNYCFSWNWRIFYISKL